MFGVLPIQTVEVGKYGRRFFEADAVFLKISSRLPRVPREHSIVYTLIPRRRQMLAFRFATGAIASAKLALAHGAVKLQPSTHEIAHKNQAKQINPALG